MDYILYSSQNDDVCGRFAEVASVEYSTRGVVTLLGEGSMHPVIAVVRLAPGQFIRAAR